MKAFLIYSALLVCLIGLSSAATNKEPCKSDEECDQTKFLHCSKLPFDTGNNQQCLCNTGMTWQGDAPECRVRDGGKCEADAHLTTDKAMCMDGFDCGTGEDDTTGEKIHLCKRNPSGSKNVRRPKDSQDKSTTNPNKLADPDAAQASKWTEEHPVSQEAISDVKDENEKPSELNQIQDAPKPKPMGRAIKRAETGDTKPKETKPDETKPVETKPDETKPGDTKPGDTKPDASAAAAKPTSDMNSFTTEAATDTPSDAHADLDSGNGPATPEHPEGGGNYVIGDAFHLSPDGKVDKEELRKVYTKFYGSFAVNSKTLSSAVAIFALMAGTLIL